MDTKSWYLSKTIWGTIIGLAGAVLPVIGKMGVEALADNATQIAGGIAAVVGGVLAIYGRYKASQALR